MFKNLENQARMAGINRFCVRAIIINENKLLLLKRAMHDSSSSIYELPGGIVENNEPLDDALKREIKEETGLIINEIKVYLGFFDYVSKKNNTLTRQFNFVSTAKDYSNIVISADHECFKWVELKLLRNIDLPIHEYIIELVDLYTRCH